MYHQYSSPPHGWSAYDYSASPPTSPHYSYYASQYANPHVSPRGSAKRHSRKASYTATKEPGMWYSGYPNPNVAPDYSSPRKHEHVSGNFGDSKKGSKTKDGQRRTSMSAENPTYRGWYDTSFRPSRSQKRPFFPDVVADAYDESRHVYREPAAAATATADRRNASYYSAKRKPKLPTDHYFYYNQVPVFDENDSPRRTRVRRASTSTRTPQRPKVPPPKSPRQATEDDAIKAGIPSGYSIKNWDPTEAPIILLGSVFDANSLGKWIYDWTVFHHGASTPMADVAGDLWLLLIKLSGKVKRADECLDRIHRTEAREMVEDFLESGERLWARFKKLLKACEHFMWKAAKREGGKGGISMGRNAGCEFVESIFGRDRELENTEKLMNSIRMWNMRFDANCEQILRRPSAT